MDGLRHAHTASASPDAEDRQSDDFDSLISKLITASRDLVRTNLKLRNDNRGFHVAMYCDECKMHLVASDLVHTKSCRSGRVFELLGRIQAYQQAFPNRKEIGQPETASAKSGASSRVAPLEPSVPSFDEPWTVREWEYQRVGYSALCSDEGGNMLPALVNDRGMHLEILERIAACVNFCAGIPIKTLKAQPPMIDVKADIARQIAAGSVLRIGGSR